MMKIITAGIALALLVEPAWAKTAPIVCTTAIGGRIVVTPNPGARTASVMLPSGQQSFGSYAYRQGSDTVVQTDTVTLIIRDDGRGSANVGANPGTPVVCRSFRPMP